MRVSSLIAAGVIAAMASTTQAKDKIDDNFGDIESQMEAVPATKPAPAAASGKGMLDTSDDEFLDAGAPAAKKPAKAVTAPDDPFTQMMKRAQYQLDLFTTYFPMGYNNRQVVDDHVVGWGKFQVTTRASLTPDTQFNLKMHAVGSTVTNDHQGAVTAPGAHSNRAKWVDVDTLSLAHQIGANTVTIGKAPLSMGLSTLYSPIDRYEPGYAADPTQSFRTGRWQARYDRAVGDDQLTLAILPTDEASAVPHKNSRWFGGTSNYAFTAMPTLAAGTSITENYHDAAARNWGYLGRYKGTANGFDYFGLLHYGPTIYPILRQRGLGLAEIYRPMAGTMAAGVSTTVDRWEFHGEASWQVASHNQDQDFIKHVVGFSYRDSALANTLGMDEIQPILEYAGEVITDQQSRTAQLLANSSASRPFRDALLARLVFRVSDSWSAYLGGAQNFVDRDQSASAGAEYKYAEDIKFKLDMSAFGGEADTWYGRWRRNDFVRFGIVITR